MKLMSMVILLLSMVVVVFAIILLVKHTTPSSPLFIVPSSVLPIPPSPPSLPVITEQRPRTSYQQIGYLQDKDEVLPLLGRPHPAHRHKWQYFTMANSAFGISVPVSVNGKNCSGEYGCDEIVSSDPVSTGLNPSMKANIYDRNMYYNPLV
jgi:hypothetical protein